MNYPPYNPYNQMNPYQTMPQQRPAMAPQMPQQQGFSMRPVTCVEEVSVAQIPFDGSTHWFYNTSGDMIHAKTFDFSTGTAPITTYVRQQPAPVVKYATLDDLRALREELMTERTVTPDAE